MPDKSTIGSRINWPIIAIVVGGLLIIIILVWQIVSHRSSFGKRKPIRNGAARLQVQCSPGNNQHCETTSAHIDVLANHKWDGSCNAN